jgi:hypothetical protein
MMAQSMESRAAMRDALWQQRRRDQLIKCFRRVSRSTLEPARGEQVPWCASGFSTWITPVNRTSRLSAACNAGTGSIPWVIRTKSGRRLNARASAKVSRPTIPCEGTVCSLPGKWFSPSVEEPNSRLRPPSAAHVTPYVHQSTHIMHTRLGGSWFDRGCECIDLEVSLWQIFILRLHGRNFGISSRSR